MICKYRSGFQRMLNFIFYSFGRKVGTYLCIGILTIRHPLGSNLADLHHCLTDYWTGLAVFTNKQVNRKEKKQKTKNQEVQFSLQGLSEISLLFCKTQVCTLAISYPYYYNLISEPLKTSSVMPKASVLVFVLFLARHEKARFFKC